MSWFKKLKKSRRTSKPSASLGAPSNVGAAPLAIGAGQDSDVDSEGALCDFGIDGVSLTDTIGVNKREGSLSVFGEFRDQPTHASRFSASTDGNKGCVAREYALLRVHGFNANPPDSSTRT